MQNHIYELGLLGGRCSDIRIRAFGRIYHLHRLVLIQSGFFRAMLCGGYAEDLAAASAAATLSKGNSHSTSSAHATGSTSKDADNDVVQLHFDDPNISRAAFEYSIARLYGDGPKLVLPFWSTPSSDHPFTPALSMRLSQSNDLKMANLLIDKRSHPATPRFLLSLLATSIYLNIPSVTAQALTLVLCSMTPFTVTQYLRFAIGCGIEGTDLNRSASDEMRHDLDEWDWELEGPARTLEEIARLDPTSSTSPQLHSERQFRSYAAGTSDDLSSAFANKLHVAPSAQGMRRGSSASPERKTSRGQLAHGAEMTSTPSRSNITTRDDTRSAQKTAGFREPEPAGLGMVATGSITPQYHYGTTADKIGEACVCWYARWGFNIFELESSMERERVIEIETWISMCREDRDLARLTLLRDRLHTGDVDLLHTSMLPRGRMPDSEERMPSPRLRVWSYPSMPSAWVRAVISSDGFYVPSELHRYEFAKKVVEFRRKQKALITVLDRLIDEWMREDEEEILRKATAAPDSNKKTGAAPKASTSSAASSDIGDGFGFKAFRRTTSSVDGDSDMDPASTPLQEAWDDGVESTAFSATLDEDEAEYEELFSSGIYYSHMPFQALNKISADISPSTGRSYTPLSVLQAALWVSNELKTHILSSQDPLQRRESSATLHDPETASQAASAEQGDSSDPEADGSGELGVSSSIVHFRDAFESTLPSAGRFSRSRSGTPGYKADDSDATLSFGSTSGLGGLAASPLMLGTSGGGKAALLDKRFYLVPSDDTVRFGDSLTSVVGSVVPSSSAASRATGSDDERSRPSAAFADDPLGPSGIAAIQIPRTLPIPAVMHHDPSHPSTHRRDRSHFYGIANDVATGRELGSYASDLLTQPPSPSSALFDHPPTRRSVGGEDPDSFAETSSLSSTSSDPPERWTGYEPMRVGVEFFGIDKLHEKQRLYSPTFFYAGSVWNLYVQVVKKVKGVQLGVYLHRQSMREDLPLSSAPDAEEVMARGDSTPRGGSFFDASFASPVSGGGVGSTLTLPHGTTTTRLATDPDITELYPGGPTVRPTSAPAIPYRDPRPHLRAYFSIHCPSPLGNALTKFSSGPDKFTVSQSWGWKSSSLLGTVWLDGGELDGGKAGLCYRFRCVCSIGLV
ncbi:BTB/POZ fold [Kalmanozyma brasiliensis GHG001]|uniref:BTB domain-containing protein n=1 Tax=Kalmanozyma brasiliensis (strain GHG001) TaxID=1365824 RepID=V5GJZ2_KALBG|nr:BTB/POZ fold [Kalmanozyma brasiliensis GHG001]EST06282.1 BTB/POZ fold [Kalmanozyma brasiliensis GHG001]